MKKILIISLLTITIFACFLNSCKKQVVPTVTTSSVADITGTATSCGGGITDQGSGDITDRGICWSTGGTPTISDYKASSGAGIDDFTALLQNLDISTTYYVRAYATNKAGTGYGEIRSFTTLLADYDGNNYTTVTAGIQVWMVENLKTTRYNDGTAIPLAPAVTNWSTMNTPAYWWYNDDDATYKAAYGALYNWYAVNTGKLCPKGWHIPSYSEWVALSSYLTDSGHGFGGSGSDIGKSLAATSGWLASSEPGSIGNDQPGNNRSGFKAMPGGMFIEGEYFVLGETGSWWSSTAIDGSAAAWSRQLNYSGTGFSDVAYSNHCGLSVRCIRD